jgi:hypothetical protein
VNAGVNATILSVQEGDSGYSKQVLGRGAVQPGKSFSNVSEERIASIFRVEEIVSANQRASRWQGALQFELFAERHARNLRYTLIGASKIYCLKNTANFNLIKSDMVGRHH